MKILIFILFLNTVSLNCYSKNIYFYNNPNKGDTINVEFTDVDIKCVRIPNEFIIVTNEEEIKELVSQNRISWMECSDYMIPEIDFKKFILIGIDIGAGGCEKPEIKRNIIKINSRKEYIYMIDIKQFGLCKVLYSFYYWVLIPKTESNFSIKLKKTKKIDEKYK